jgi:hypothetical protein
MSEKKPSFLEESLKIMSACPICQSRYNQDSVKIIAKQEESYLLHVTCIKCKSAVLAYVMHTGVGLTTVGLLTDLQADEVEKFSNMSNLNEDDILDVYKLLKNNSKDFVKSILNK